jgi:sphingomyelin phosphodiesterase
MREFAPEFISMLNETDIVPETICQRMMLCPVDVPNVSLDIGDPEVIPDSSSARTPLPKTIPEEMLVDSEDIGTMLQFTDFHFDLFYEEGTNKNCHLPMCCRSTDAPLKHKDDAARYWYLVCCFMFVVLACLLSLFM